MTPGSAPSDAEADTRAVVGLPAAGHDSGPVSVGTSLGRYAVLEEVGRGGMGRVLRAYDPKLQREVAIKELRSHLLDEEGARRLVAEARAMAQLSHPNVVAVYDVESFDDGRHVLVMEYVAGGTLRGWLAVGDRGWRDVVAQFVRAGRGLAAAHAAGLLHRDFKPANVLVGDGDVVKVTDFGLAKLDPSSISRDAPPPMGGSSDSITGTGSVMGTPRYMAPEQHYGAALSAATDQYAFCVSAWEALAREPPFSGRSSSQLAARKAAGPPPWPNSDVPRRLVDALRRGLAPDPSDRWPDMASLLAALEPPARGRTTAVVGLVAIAGLATVGVLARSQAAEPPCRGAAEQIAGVWNDARRDEIEAAMLGTRLPYADSTWTRTEQALERYASDWTAMHRETCEATAVRREQSAAVLDLRMGCLQRAKTVAAAVTDVLASADADVVRNANAVLGGLPPLERCADVAALQADVEPPAADEAEAVGRVRALVAQSNAERSAGRGAAARPAIDAAAEQVESLGYAAVHADVSLSRGLLLADLGELEASEAALQDAMEWGARARQWETMQEAASQLLYVVGRRQGRFDAAAGYRATALGLAHGDPVREAGVHNHFASALTAHGDLARAEEEIRTALSLYEEVTDPDLHNVDAAHVGLGIVLLGMGRYDEAEAEFRATIEMQEARLDPRHPALATTHNNLANALYGARRLADAEAEYRRAEDIWREAYGATHPRLADTRHNIALTLNDRGEYARAEQEYRQAIEQLADALGPRHPAAVTFRYNLANCLRDQGRAREAEEEFQRAVSLGEEVLDAEQPMLAIARTSLADMMLQRGADADALAVVQAAWTRNEREDVDPVHRAWTAFVLARALWETRPNERARARELAERSLADYRVHGDTYADEIEVVTNWLGQRPAA